MKREIVGLVAVRTASSRLTNKAFRLLGGRPIIEILVDRLKNTPYLDGVVICTTTLPGDDAIEEYCQKKGVLCHRGEEKNVLARFLGAADKMPSDYIVRITGDNPLSDFENMKLAFEYMKANNGDYARPIGLPLGTACEIVRAISLREIDQRTSSHDLTEYMTWFFELAPFIKNTLHEVKPEHYFPELRLTVDYESDLVFLQQLFDHFGRVPNLSETVAYCRTLKEYPRVKDDPKAAEEIKSRIKFK